MEKGKTYLRNMGLWSREKSYQIIIVLSDPYKTDSFGEPDKAVKVDYILTKPDEPVVIKKNVEFGFQRDDEEEDEEIFEVGSEEYKKKTKRICKLFIKRIFTHGIQS